MTTLRISQLSVGDWVRVINQFDAQIDGYHSESGSLSLVTRQRHLVHYRLEDIHPIPITPEILEANGFVKNGGVYKLSNKKHLVFVWLMEFSHFVDVEEMNGLSATKSSRIEVSQLYVHQLQHILRLAGIDKEIVMPKK